MVYLASIPSGLVRIACASLYPNSNPEGALAIIPIIGSLLFFHFLYYVLLNRFTSTLSTTKV